MFFGRKNVIEEIEYNIKRQKSTLIVGIKGIGKSTLLKEIQLMGKYCLVNGGTAKQIIQKMIKYYNIHLKPLPLTVDQMAELLASYLTKKNLVLLIDDFELLNKTALRVLDKLCSNGLTVIAASEKKPKFEFREIIEIPSLTHKEAQRLAASQIYSPNKLLLNLIVTKSERIPGEIVRLCRDYELAAKLKDIVPHKRASLHNFIANQKPRIINRVNLLPLWLLFVIGFTLLLIRYFFYGWDNYQEGYITAMFGYISLILYRLITMKDYEK